MWHCYHDPMFSCFSRTLTCDRHRQIRNDSIYCMIRVCTVKSLGMWCCVDFLEHTDFNGRILSFHLMVAFLITSQQWEVSSINWQVCHNFLHFWVHLCMLLALRVWTMEFVQSCSHETLSFGISRRLRMDHHEIWAVGTNDYFLWLATKIWDLYVFRSLHSCCYW